jgi:tetratricopeptide (TPR) repeat protein
MATKQVKSKKSVEDPPRLAAIKNLFRINYIPYIVFTFSFLVYFNTLFNDYNLDDELVTQNHRLTSKGISAIPEIFSSPYYEDKAGYKYEYRPIVLVTFAIEHTFFGDNPHVSHFFNVLLYAFLCVFLFNVLIRLLKGYSPWFVAIIVLLFAVHPVHTEVVASIKNRDELLALFFSLAALDMALRYVYTKKVYWLPLVPFFLYLGILSKTTALVFAVIIPVLLLGLTSVSFSGLILITTLLAFPALAYSRLYSVLQQILLLVGLIGSVSFLYLVKNYNKVWQAAINEIKRLKSPGLAAPNVSDGETAEFSFSVLRNPLVSVPFVLLVLVLMLVALSGVRMGNLWAVVAPFTLLAVLFAVVRKELKTLLVFPVTLITCYAMYRYKATSIILEAPLIVFIVSQFLLSKNKHVRAVAFLSYVLYSITALIALHSVFFLVIPLFAVLYHQKFRWVSLLAVVVLTAAFAKGVYSVSVGFKPFTLVLLRIPILLLGFSVLWSRKASLISSVPAFILSAVMLLYFLVTPPPKNNSVTSVIQRNYYKANQLKAVELTPVQAVRLLKKIEYPLEKNDPLRIKLGTYMIVMGKYLKLIVFPYPLSFYYGYAYIVPTDFFTTWPVIVAIVHLLLLLTALFCIKRLPLVSVSLFIYTISILIFSGIFIPVPGMMGDRFLFIPSIGFSILLAWVLFYFFKQEKREGFTDITKMQHPLRLTLIVLLVVYSLATVARNANWKNRITLFSHDINVVEKSAQAQNLLGLHLLIESNKTIDKVKQAQLRNEAINHFTKAIEIYPEFLNASYDLGRTYEMMGRLDEAYRAYEHTTKIDTGFYAPLFSMGIIQDQRGNVQAAIELYEKYLKKYPSHKEAYANLSYAYFRVRDFEKSIYTNQRLLLRTPNAYEPTVNIAKTYLEMGEKDSAYVYFLKSYQLNPRDPNITIVLNQLARDIVKK